MKLVVDTSVMAKCFLNETDRSAADAIVESAISKNIELIAPTLLLYELNNVFVSNGVRGADYDRAIVLLSGWVDEGVIELCEADLSLMRRAESIASLDTYGQGYISSFDATFHALALREGATLVTADATYVRKTQSLVGHVVLLSEFVP